MSKAGCVALLGDFSDERLPLSSIGREFSWSASRVANIGELEALCRWTKVVAVLIHTRTLNMPWHLALSLARAVAPEARVVICHGAGEASQARQMTDEGAFHTLLLPLEMREVRQSLGFIASASRTPLGALVAQACAEVA